jgi:hypothetical protein
MFDSRRDRRYRLVAHRSIGVGLRKVTFHDMPGTPEEVPDFDTIGHHFYLRRACSAAQLQGWLAGLRKRSLALPEAQVQRGQDE